MLKLNSFEINAVAGAKTVTYASDDGFIRMCEFEDKANPNMVYAALQFTQATTPTEQDKLMKAFQDRFLAGKGSGIIGNYKVSCRKFPRQNNGEL